jgi:hypothetical protein
MTMTLMGSNQCTRMMFEKLKVRSGSPLFDLRAQDERIREFLIYIITVSSFPRKRESMGFRFFSLQESKSNILGFPLARE